MKKFYEKRVKLHDLLHEESEYEKKNKNVVPVKKLLKGTGKKVWRRFKDGAG